MLHSCSSSATLHLRPGSKGTPEQPLPFTPPLLQLPALGPFAIIFTAMQPVGNVNHVWDSVEDHILHHWLLAYFRVFETSAELCSPWDLVLGNRAQCFGVAEVMGNCSFLWREFQLLQTQIQLRKILQALIYLSVFERYKLTHCRELQRNSKSRCCSEGDLILQWVQKQLNCSVWVPV